MGTLTRQQTYLQPLTKGEIEARLGAEMPLDPPRMTVEEYLRTGWKPECELIDGELREKPMPTRLRGFIQMMIGAWFQRHMDEWGVAPESEVRTQVRAGNFRLPDVAVTPMDIINTRTQDKPPIIAIEILSEGDGYSDLCRRAADLRGMGVENIWLIDPEQRAALVWGSAGSWEPAAQLQVLGTPIHLDLSWLWAQVQKRAEKA